MITSGSISSNSLNQTIIATNQENVLCSKQEVLDGFQPCNHGEADYRLLLHVYDASRKRFRSYQNYGRHGSRCNRIVLIFFRFISMSCGSNLVLVNIENCSLFRGRILLSNTNLLCFNWLWHSFAICRNRETNCVASLEMLLWSNGDISEVCFCVGLFIRKKYIYKFHKIFLIRNYWKWKGCRITQNNDTVWKSFEFR